MKTSPSPLPGSLSSYKSKIVQDAVEYEFGMQPRVEVSAGSSSRGRDPRQPPSPTEDVSIKPASEEDDFNWSDAQTSDMLF